MQHYGIEEDTYNDLLENSFFETAGFMVSSMFDKLSEEIKESSDIIVEKPDEIRMEKRSMQSLLCKFYYY